ncbi:MAG TPA: hypothetical protein VI756_05775 [Blastocatellia bacterium]
MGGGLRRALACCIAGALVGLAAHKLALSSVPAVSAAGGLLIVPGYPGVLLVLLFGGRLTPHDVAFFNLMELFAALFYAILFYLPLAILSKVRRRTSGPKPVG